MNLIIPMAGMGKRLRPHTLTTPKPLIPIAGKPIVQRLVEDIAKVTPEKIDQIGFVIGDFGAEVEKRLLEIANSVGAVGKIFYQEEALGTAHAVDCAKDLLEGRVSVAFADTLFRAEFTLDTEQDGIIWVKEIEDPSAFGVVKEDNEGIITEFVEKPKEPVSNRAIIGIYYFKEGELLRKELAEMITNDTRTGGEFQLTVALENLKRNGIKFKSGVVDDWLDCGNKEVTVESNSRYLGFIKDEKQVQSGELINCTIIEPVFVGSGTIIRNSTIGPGVSIGENCNLQDCHIEESLIQSDCELSELVLSNSMLGNSVKIRKFSGQVSLGDFSVID